MAIRPPYDIASHWATASTLVTLGTNLFIGPTRSDVASSSGATLIPSASAFVRGTGGTEPRVTMGRGADIRTATGQTRVRSASTAFASGETMAEDFIRRINFSAPPTGYLDLVTLQSSPMYLGRDAKQRHEWSINWAAQYQST